LDLKELKALLQILDEREVAEFELEEQGLRLRIRKAAAPPDGGTPLLVAPVTSASGPTGPSAAPAAAPPASSPPAPAAAAEEETGTHVVKSPIVGTFYRAPDPASPAFVNVGDHVRVGQVLCIIEAMKLMNEIEAEVAGEIVKVHHDNGQPVQYGEPLFSVRPDR
jgi:acetyl-CoA carboxylase biotin carboxyl carrier protein